MQKIDSSHSADLGGVVNKSDVSLRSCVQLLYLNVTEAPQKLRPDVSADAVAYCDPYFVLLLIVPL